MSPENHVTPERLRNLDLLQSTILRIHMVSSSVVVGSRLDDPNFKISIRFLDKNMH